MEYCTFNVKVAEKVGVPQAVILEYIRFWVESNTFADTNGYEGKHWTYNSIRALTGVFPFFSDQQLRRVFKKLEDEEYIESSNFNQKAYDRTKWYTLTEKGWMLWKPCNSSFVEIDKCIYQNRQMDVSKSTNGFAQIDKPIPYNIYNNNIYNNTSNTDNSTSNTDSNTDSTTSNNNKKDSTKISRTKQVGYLAIDEQIWRFTECEELATALREFVIMRKSIKKPPTPYAFFRLLNKLKGLADNDLKMAEIVNQSIEHNWQDFYPLKGETGSRIDEVLKLAKEREEDGINF